MKGELVIYVCVSTEKVFGLLRYTSWSQMCRISAGISEHFMDIIIA